MHVYTLLAPDQTMNTFRYFQIRLETFCLRWNSIYNNYVGDKHMV